MWRSQWDRLAPVTTVLFWEAQGKNPYLTSLGCPWVPEPPPGDLQVEVPGPAFTRSWLSRVAFLCWLLANVMLSMPVLVYGGHMLLATGIFQLLGLLFFSMATSLTPPCPLRLGTAILHIHHGPAFWITLTTGEAQPNDSTGELRAREGGSGTIVLMGLRAWVPGCLSLLYSFSRVPLISGISLPSSTFPVSLYMPTPLGLLSFSAMSLIC